MKKNLLIFSVFALSFGKMNAQTENYWVSHDESNNKAVKNIAASRENFPKEFKLYDLNVENFKNELFSIIGNSSRKHTTVISLPNAQGKMEKFEISEASNFEPALQERFPEIRSFSGKGIDDKYATLKLSYSPYGLQTMVSRVEKESEFIEVYSQNHKTYAVYKSQRTKGQLPFTCSTDDRKMMSNVSQSLSETSRSSAGQLKTMRLAQSVTGEYSAYYATLAGQPASVAISLAAINATLTRCNGVYEKDLGLHLNLINNTTIIYLDAATDPYGPTDANYNTELQNTLTSVVTNANYDIGHLFSAIGNNGNAGCIGCVCTDDTPSTTDENKGSGFTTSTNPIGDFFDIDFVVHEVGHQLGANHTFSMANEGTGVNMEPGSGITIMGYAGITDQDVAPHSIDKYHAASINQIQVNLATKACPITTNISANNATPIANAGLDYTIPRSTPFKLTGSATDTNSGDVLTYSWEQMDNASGTQTDANSAASITKATGPNWTSYDATTSGERYFPRLQTTLANSQTTSGAEIAVEALSSVARTLNFRLTVRDNAPFSSTAPVKVGQTNFDDTVITVSGSTGPFDVTSQATVDQTWAPNSTQTIAWAVNGTNLAYAPNVAGDQFVDILLSTDGGLTFPTVLASNTANDGSETITVPNITSTNARVMVKARSHIFYDINPQPIAIGYTISNTCNTYANNTALPIPDGTGISSPILGPVVSNTITVPVTYNLTDVNVNLNVTHSYINDILVAVNHPDATQVMLWNGFCGSQDNFNITFSDGNPTPTCSGNNTTGTFAPASPLSAFNGKVANGTWTLLAGDAWQGDTGQVNSWSLEVCNKTFTLDTAEFEFQDFKLFPNPNKGNFSIKFTSENSNDVKISVTDLRGRQVYEKSFSNEGIFDQTISLNNVQSGIYLVTATDGVKKTVKRIVVE